MVSDMLLYKHSGRLHPLSAIPYTGIMVSTEGLAGNTQQFKTISFVLCNVLYLTYTTPLVIICHTIESQ